MYPRATRRVDRRAAANIHLRQRQVEVGGGGEVERLPAELHRRAFGDGEPARTADVEREEPRAVEDIAAGTAITEGAARHQRERRAIKPLVGARRFQAARRDPIRTDRFTQIQRHIGDLRREWRAGVGARGSRQLPFAEDDILLDARLPNERAHQGETMGLRPANVDENGSEGVLG